MQIDLTDDEAAALLALMDRAIAIDSFLLLPQTRTLRGIRPKILRAPRAEPPAPRPTQAGWPRR
jgi:hypothetical protein